MRIAKIGVSFVMVAIFIAMSISAQAANCCTNPNNPATITCQDIARTDCCPQPETTYPTYYSSTVPNQQACLSGFFTEGKSCNENTACDEVVCCCPKGEQKLKAYCNETYKPAEPGKTCSELCETPGGIPQTGCGTELSPSAINVKGEIRLTIAWKQICNAANYAVERCKGASCSAFQSLANSAQTNYQDTDLQWSETYTYKITSNTGQTATLAAYTGDVECYKRTNSNSFCISDALYEEEPIKQYLITLWNEADVQKFREKVIAAYGSKFNTPRSCDATNKLAGTSNPCPKGTSCTVATGKAECASASSCGTIGKPFGLFTSKTLCETQQGCYYDKSQGNVDSCYGCMSKMSCYDYKSKGSCEANKCSVGTCAWKPLIDELGTGVCIDMAKNNCANCGRKTSGTKGYNDVFDVCTASVLKGLSTPQYDCEAQAVNCAISCKTKAQNCNDFSGTLGDDNVVAPKKSNTCGLSVCMQSGSDCKKDADFDKAADCSSDDCEKDYFVPETTVSQSGDKITILVNDREKSTDFAKFVSTATTYLCGFKQSETRCNKAKDFNFSTTKRQELVQNLVNAGVLRPGQNKLKFYSKDLNKNLEVVKETPVFVGDTPELPGFNMTLKQPKFGATNSTTYTAILETSRPATCRTSFLDPNRDFESMTPMQTTNGKTHTMALTLIGSMNVKCRDNLANTISRQFIITLVIEPKITNAYADPVTDLPIKTTLSAEADQMVVCRFAKQDTIQFTDMTKFTGYDEDKEESYKFLNQQNLTTELADKQTNNFYVQCKNKASQLTSKFNVVIPVDTNAQPTLTLDYRQFYPNTSVSLGAITNKLARCQYANNLAFTLASDFSAAPTRNHKTTIQLTAGNFTYHVRCSFDTATMTASASFTVDTTAPTKPNVRDSKTNQSSQTSRSRIDGEWISFDPESGIKLYQYSVNEQDSNTVILNWTQTSSTSEAISGLSLQVNKSYYVSARAQNNAGLWSETARSPGIAIIGGNECDNSQKDSSETDTDCGGICKGCQNGKKCSSNSDCSSRYCVKGECGQPGCSDEKRNGNETDEDCGGNCDQCGQGKDCVSDGDCASGNCKSGKCGIKTSGSSCFNGQLDQDETDVDCGRFCSSLYDKKCGSGKQCIISSDCASGNCISNRCSSNRSSTSVTGDRDGDSLPDASDNCPNTYNKDQADTDSDGTGDSCDPDLDNDGMDDTWEISNGLNPIKDDAEADDDGDGLSNIKEFEYSRDYTNINPKLADTDGDGASDKEEIDANTNPSDASEKPESSGHFLKLVFWVLGAVMAAGTLIFIVKKYVLGRERDALGLPTNKQMQQQMRQQPQTQVQPIQKPLAPKTKIQTKLAKKMQAKNTEQRKEIFKEFNSGEKDVFKKIDEELKK